MPETCCERTGLHLSINFEILIVLFLSLSRSICEKKTKQF